MNYIWRVIMMLILWKWADAKHKDCIIERQHDDSARSELSPNCSPRKSLMVGQTQSQYMATRCLYTSNDKQENRPDRQEKRATTRKKTTSAEKKIRKQKQT